MPGTGNVGIHIVLGEADLPPDLIGLEIMNTAFLKKPPTRLRILSKTVIFRP